MDKKISSVRPLLLLVLTNMLGMLLVMIKEHEPDKNMAVLCIVMCVVNIGAYIVLSLFKLGDVYLFVITSMLATVGVIMQTRIDADGGIRQMILYLAGSCVFFAVLAVYGIFHKYFSRFQWVFFGISILLFIITAIFGTEKYGSKNWIIVGGISIQPSEFIRILFVLSMAAVFTNGRRMDKKEGRFIKEAERKKRKRLITSAVIAYINLGFLLLQREWGISVLFFAVYLSFLYIYGESKLFTALNVLAAICGGAFGCMFMSHIKVRVATWLDPFADITGKGYQITQSLFAIASGGFTGSGIGCGSPYFIPVVSSDFIFSAICEEMGVLGATAVILLYFVLVYRGFKIALSSTNKFHKAVSVGLSVMLGVQTFIILGGVTKLIPLTGITLPFISYGGSSMITTFSALGILQAVSSMKGEVTDEIK